MSSLKVEEGKFFVIQLEICFQGTTTIFVFGVLEYCEKLELVLTCLENFSFHVCRKEQRQFHLNSSVETAAVFLSFLE